MLDFDPRFGPLGRCLGESGSTASADRTRRLATILSADVAG